MGRGPIINKHEAEVLESIWKGTPLEWGAWVGACIDFLQEDGYLTRGQTLKVTDAGLTALTHYNYARQS